MNIYIYGGNSFRNKVHASLDHGNIKFKIEDGEIIDIFPLENFKNKIKDEPTEIFIIDQNKIITDDFISKYLKFLIPKDGIKKAFLDEYGLGDINMSEISDISLYIEKRIQAKETLNPKVKAEELTTIEEMLDCYE
ncbi:MAG: hypothetical protein U9Q20_04425 [Campylobacterota bacterium]|nr:hypothetical protein [Campylobacterota bacterium]